VKFHGTSISNASMFTRETEQGSANSWKEGSAYSSNKWGEIVP